jgi:hypothetical protein
MVRGLSLIIRNGYCHNTDYKVFLLIPSGAQFLVILPTAMLSCVYCIWGQCPYTVAGSVSVNMTES